MNPILYTVDGLSFESSLAYQRIIVVVGQEFHYSKRDGRMHLNLSRGTNSELVPIDNLEVGKDAYSLHARSKGKTIAFKVSYNSWQAAPILVDFINQTIVHGFRFDEKYQNDFELKWELDFHTLRLSTHTGETISYYASTKRGSHLYQRTNGSFKPDQYMETAISVNDASLEFVGKEVETNCERRIDWQLDFQPDLLQVVTQLLKISIDVSSTKQH